MMSWFAFGFSLSALLLMVFGVHRLRTENDRLRIMVNALRTDLEKCYARSAEKP